MSEYLKETFSDDKITVLVLYLRLSLMLYLIWALSIVVYRGI